MRSGWPLIPCSPFVWDMSSPLIRGRLLVLVGRRRDELGRLVGRQCRGPQMVEPGRMPTDVLLLLEKDVARGAVDVDDIEIGGVRKPDYGERPVDPGVRAPGERKHLDRHARQVAGLQ